MRVDEFSIGFPPRLYSWKRGETLYSLNLIPIGGYVKIYGENPGSEDSEEGSFNSKPLFNRIAVMVAGVIMNALFAFVVLTIAFSVGFISAVQDASQLPNAHVVSSQVIIAQVLDNSAASKAGLEGNDVVTQITNGATGQVSHITSAAQLQEVTKTIQTQTDRHATLDYSRDGVVGQVKLEVAASGPALGVGLASLSVVRFPVWRAPIVALQEIKIIVEVTWQALKNFAIQLFGHAHLDQSVSGPIGIYQATASAAKQGVIPVISLMTILSVNLALLNILPIPALDGGRLLFLLIELVFRRKVVAQHIESAVSAYGVLARLNCHYYS